MVGLSAHKIPEGEIGIYFTGGALQEEFTRPGIHYSNPVMTDVKLIKIRDRTDTLDPLEIITKDGIKTRFDNVQVISGVKPEKVVALVKKYGLEFHETMVFDRIKEEIRIFCANHTIDEVYSTMFLDIVKKVQDKTKETIMKLGEGGITIKHLAISKPDIPEDIANNYKDVKVQWTMQLVATQQQKTEKIKKETESIKAVADAERSKKVQEIDIQKHTLKAVADAERSQKVQEIEINKQTLKAVADAERKKQVQEIDLKKQILEKEGEKNISSLNNFIVKEREENRANVEKYAKEQLAAANVKLFDNKAYVQLETAKSLSQNTKFFFSGEGSPLGSILAKVMNN